ncbi:nucleoid occlusion factor SlmA [Pseudidiomarina terrestris]|uniref:Nucleoid occlusion factor SlmA n=1 Tax=Pseudidiomarina terrestris TaxID=2820060 RepID=A0AAW7QZD4_9GAMM|nr:MULTISPECIES: nucleoid occlusion factor SlmA [unclassified Pseudidiomarina]MDN7125585.1 nucleoid occlusion factor SlmA [Pseudidiomarina sp. 1APP75-32.1]MDN7126167.1 nucleoid occlusion factor SlmA [Pseudidiomarina sp. 1APR75-33.1]MDN7130552.1 nucleoid occlusion factor SlmA [Pseudidiomarina sp. 1APR75-15]MDN7134193.1 nucleoid occlusion factor SlmA [Pseudidiomarina sp. 1ASP75-5]MDN7137120.1 nucleoid occlusion factor SlmA [Pseudidiomarina sp. 1ASP75-14]
MTTSKKPNRKEQILGTLAAMLETSPGQRITTKNLAAELGVSEAALYRHFPSKARMFEGLIEFTEEAVLSRINQVMEVEKDTLIRCEMMLRVVLTFVERNPGITRILTGDALMGEHDRLRSRVQNLFAKIESNLKQALRERRLRENVQSRLDEAVLANLLMAYADGKIAQFVRSEFKQTPTTEFDAQWQTIAHQLL